MDLDDFRGNKSKMIIRVRLVITKFQISTKLMFNMKMYETLKPNFNKIEQYEDTIDNDKENDENQHLLEEYKSPDPESPPNPELQHPDSSQSSLLSSQTHPPQSPKTPKLTKNQLRQLKIDTTPYKNLSILKKLIRIFTPFEIMQRKIWISDCFIYPQILLSSILLCFFSMWYLGYKTFGIIFSITGYMDARYDKVYDTSFAYLRSGLKK
jgi:hypothetical protein